MSALPSSRVRWDTSARENQPLRVTIDVEPSGHPGRAVDESRDGNAQQDSSGSQTPIIDVCSESKGIGDSRPSKSADNGRLGEAADSLANAIGSSTDLRQLQANVAKIDTHSHCPALPRRAIGDDGDTLCQVCERQPGEGASKQADGRCCHALATITF